MLEMKQNCENCGKLLPSESDEAVICSYECTYCTKCTAETLQSKCPNCGGNLEKRPKRIKKDLK
jgi:uncharacterized protein